MRRARRLTAIVVLTVIVSGCGAEERKASTVPVADTALPSTDVETSTEPSTSSVVSSVETSATFDPAPIETDETSAGGSVAEAMLRIEDLPSGWVVVPPEAESEEGESCVDKAFAEFGLGATVGGAENALAGEVFSQSSFGPFLSVGITGAEGDVSQRVFDEFPAAVASCDGVAEPDGTVWRYLPVDFPIVGEKTFVMQMQAESPFGPIDVVAAFAQNGGYIVTVANVALSGAADIELVKFALQTVVDRL